MKCINFDHQFELYAAEWMKKNAEKYKKERQAWFDANMEVVNGKKQPKMSIYGNKAYQNLTPIQREYYDKVMYFLDCFRNVCFGTGIHCYWQETLLLRYCNNLRWSNLGHCTRLDVFVWNREKKEYCIGRRN